MSSKYALMHCLMACMGLPLAACNDSTSSMTPNAIQATASMSSVAGVAGSNQTLSITFVSNDRRPITNLSVSALSALPAGWSGPGNFSCAQVTTGSGCVLDLTYAPTAGGSGTLTVGYGFTNSDGAPISATVSIPYSATAHDNVVVTGSPAGQINAVVNDGSQPVTVTFTTDDGLPASGLTLTSSLSALPAGWSSSATSFACATVSTGASCQLALAYAPLSVGSGTLTLTYGYTDDAGTAKTGSASIAYAATTDDNVVGTVSPSGQVTATVDAAGTAVTVTFTTDDGNPATDLSVSSGLGGLPGDWSAPSSFSCATVSDGSACELALSYAPTSTESGTISLGYGYTNDAGNTKSGTLSIPYAAIAPHLYVANLYSTLDECTLAGNGALSSCTPTPGSGGSSSPTGIVFNGQLVYVTDFYPGNVDICTVNSDGSFSDCEVAASGLSYPWALTINGNYLYIASNTGATTYCQIGSGGVLSDCIATASGISQVNGIAIGGGYAYLSLSGSVDECAVNADGSLTGCVSTGSGFNSAQFIVLSSGYAYIGNQQDGSVAVCSIGTGGALITCTNYPVGYKPNGIALYGGYLYASDINENVYQCVLGNNGALTGCVVSDGGATFSAPQQLAIH